MTSTAARRRSFAIRAKIAKRDAANDAGAFAVPPAGTFKLTVKIVLKETVWGFNDDGSYTIESARLTLVDGAEIDGATVTIDATIAENLDLTLLYAASSVTGDAVVTDDGYRLLSYEPTDLRQAA